MIHVTPEQESRELQAIARAAKGELERRGYEVVTDLDTKLPDAFLTFSYGHQGWKHTRTSSSGTSISHSTDVDLTLALITREELRRNDLDKSMSQRAWEGRIEATIWGRNFDFVEHVPLLVRNVLAEFPNGSGLPLGRPLRQVAEGGSQ